MTLLILAAVCLSAVIYGFSVHVVTHASAWYEVLLPMFLIGPILGSLGAVVLNEILNELLDGDA